MTHSNQSSFIIMTSTKLYKLKMVVHAQYKKENFLKIVFDVMVNVTVAIGLFRARL